MALTIRGLNRELDTLRQRQLDEQRQHAEKLRRLEKQFNERMAGAIRERDALIRQSAAAAQEQYRQTLAEIIGRIERMSTEHMAQLETEYREYTERMQRLTEQISAENEAIRARIREYMNRADTLDENAQALAAECIQEAENAENSVEQRPVRRFFAGKLDSYKNLLRQARNSLASGIYQAAAAMASSARAAIEGVGADLDREIEEWVQHFTVWEALVEGARLTLDNGLRTAVPTGFGDETELSFTEFDFWSRGELAKLRAAIAVQEEEIAKVRRAGVEEYMNSEDALSTEELRERVDGARGLADTASGLLGNAAAEFAFSNSRIAAAEKVSAVLKEAGYTETDADAAGFPAPDIAAARAEWYRSFWNERVEEPINDFIAETVDPHGYYEASFIYRGGDTLVVRFVPQRLDGRVVANVCLLEIISSAPNYRDIARALISANAERIRSAVSGVAVQGVDSKRELEAKTVSFGSQTTGHRRITV